MSTLITRSDITEDIVVAAGATAEIGFTDSGYILTVLPGEAGGTPTLTAVVDGNDVSYTTTGGRYEKRTKGKVTVTCGATHSARLRYIRLIDVADVRVQNVTRQFPPGPAPAIGNTGNLTPVANTVYWQEMTVPGPWEFSAVGFVVGHTTSGSSKAIAVVYKPAGGLGSAAGDIGEVLAYSALAGTTIAAAADTYQSVPLLSTIRGENTQTLRVGVIVDNTATHLSVLASGDVGRYGGSAASAAVFNTSIVEQINLGSRSLGANQIKLVLR